MMLEKRSLSRGGFVITLKSGFVSLPMDELDRFPAEEQGI
ncbi:hypothetical protein SAMN05443253_11470 [Bacillus sp. OK048]|nr:hypothetical protein SAMN05443253_11470 [Bacillus sp. OK048]